MLGRLHFSTSFTHLIRTGLPFRKIDTEAFRLDTINNKDDGTYTRYTRERRENVKSNCYLCLEGQIMTKARSSLCDAYLDRKKNVRRVHYKNKQKKIEIRTRYEFE